ncbi:MAG: enoyl-CoA hydratase/isomerase family protein [Planctomycetota bacterium]
MSRPFTDSLSAPPVLAQAGDGVLHLQLNRPAAYNALSTELLIGLRNALRAPAGEARVLLLTGGTGAFSIGSDIRELAAMDGPAAERYSLLAHEVLAALEDWPGMTVALLDGYVIGAALELVLGCDLIAAGPDVQIGMPGLAWALLPVMGGLRHLAARCGPDLARRIFLGGAILDRSAAMQHHLLHRMVDGTADRDRLLAEALEWMPGAVLAIRELRLRERQMEAPRSEAVFFAHGFYNGECQRRLHALMDE